MSREEFLKSYENQSTINNYYKSFKKLDGFLDSIELNEFQFLDRLNKSGKHEKYNLLQEFVNYLKNDVSPRTVRQYFDNLFKYFLIQGVELDYTQKKLFVKFPRIIEKRFEGLDREKIITLLGHCSSNFSLYLRLLVGSGVRESEGLQITPRMIDFLEYPVKIKLPGEITKLSIPRETMIPPGLAKDLKEHIEEKKIKLDDVIFSRKYNQNTLLNFEKDFAEIRKKAGLETINKEPGQQNDITLHSFRAFFITSFINNELGEFGHALAGHSGSFSVYYRMSDEKKKEKYGLVMNDLEFILVKPAL